MNNERLQITIEADSSRSRSGFDAVTHQFQSLQQIALQVTQVIGNHFDALARRILASIQSIHSAFGPLQQQFGSLHPHIAPAYSPAAQIRYAPAYSGVAFAAPALVAARAARFAVDDLDPAWRGAVNNMRFPGFASSGQRFPGFSGSDPARAAAMHRLAAQAMQQFSQAANSAAQANRKFGDSMSTSMIRAGAFFAAIAGGLHVIRALTVESAKYAAQTESYGLAMHAVAQANGVASDSADALEKKIKSLGITTQATRQAITSAIAAGLDTEKLPSLARLGQNLAVMKPDMTSSQVFNSLIYGIQSGQTDVLRTIGLNVNFERAYQEYARQHKVAADALDEHTKILIRQNEVLKQASRYSGMYEAAMNSVGKQMQSLRRITDDAKEAIGKHFIPAMQLLVVTATWALKKIQENPLVARAMAMGAGTLTGAAAGAGIGALVGGAGAVPGAAIGAGLGFFGTAAALLAGQEDPGKEALDAIWGPALKKARQQEADMRRKAIEEERAQENARRQADEAAAEEAKLLAQALREAVESAQRFAGFAANEHPLTRIRRETQEAINEAASYRDKEGNLRTFTLPAAAQRDFVEGYRRRFQAVMTEIQQANAKALGASIDEYQRHWREAETRRMQERMAMLDELAHHEQANNRAILEHNLSLVAQERDARLRELDLLNAQTLPQKLAVENAKFEIEREAILKASKLRQEMIRLDTELLMVQYRMHAEMLGLSEDKIRELEARIEAISEARLKMEAADKQAQIKAAQDARRINQLRLVQTEYERIFNQLKTSSERVFDAMLTKSQSVFGAIASAFKNAVLTVIREIVSSQVARALFGMLTGKAVSFGQRVATSPGMWGAVGGTLFGLGVGATPVFGGVGYPGAPGGTPGFAGPVALGGGYGPQGGLLGNIGGGFMPGPGGISGIKDFLGFGGGVQYAPGMATTWGASSLGQKLSALGRSNAALLGGGLLALAGWQRGGWSGAGMMAAGGAMMGFKYGGPLGALIGGGIGLGIGAVKAIFGKSPEEKAKEEVKRLYGVTIKEKNILKQIVDIARAGFGGDIRVAVASREVRELVELYAQTTGQSMAWGKQMQSLGLVQSGGNITEIPQFRPNAEQFSAQSIFGSTSLDKVSATGASGGPMVVNISVPGAQEFFKQETLSVVVNNPRAVQEAVTFAHKASFQRLESRSLLTAPSQLRA